MNGYQVTFYTLQNRKVEGKAVTDWLVEKAQTLGIRGVTVLHGDESFGHDHRVHSLHFFEQAEQPVVVVMVLGASEVAPLFDLLKNNDAQIFYTKAPLEFGVIGA
jgi:PII-like signaling protein